MNAIHVIHPYRDGGTWVFDDPAVGLRREPFVAGADLVIDRMVENLPGAARGFTLLFSASPFPGSNRCTSTMRPRSRCCAMKLRTPCVVRGLSRLYLAVNSALVIGSAGWRARRSAAAAPIGCPGGRGPHNLTRRVARSTTGARPHGPG